MPDTAILIKPLDLLFFRGGRPFAAGLPGVSSLPTPQALLGLVRTFLLEKNDADFHKMRGIADPREAFQKAAKCGWLADVAVRGPFLHHRDHGLVFPAPASLVTTGEGLQTLKPLNRDIPGWTPPLSHARPLVLRGERSKDKPQFLTAAGLSQFLAGNVPERKHLVRAADLLAFDERTGIGINPETLATDEGVIYSTRKLALAPGVSFYAEILNLPADQQAHFSRALSPWGGERHHVSIEVAPAPISWPSAQPSGGRTLLYLASPCFRLAGGVPSALPVEAIRAAATVGPQSLSGWDLVKRGPKPTRFGIDAGSVFFLENTTAPDTLSDPDDSLAGYGFSLKGTWHYAD